LALQDSPTGAALSDEQGQELWANLANIARKLQKTDRLEISLQKAELALSNDNLVESYRQANTVILSSKSDSTQVESARAILDMIEIRKADASTKVSNAIAMATQSFDSGDYAKSKALITRIGLLGLTLAPAEQTTLDSYRDRLAQLEQTQGVSFGSSSIVT